MHHSQIRAIEIIADIVFFARVKAVGLKKDYTVKSLSECWSTPQDVNNPQPRKQMESLLSRGRKILQAARKRLSPKRYDVSL